MRTNYKVEQLLRDYPKLRDSDMGLLIGYWASEGLDLSEQQVRQLMNCTNAETITRIRRKLRAKYPGSPKIEEERFSKFKEFRNDYSTAPNAHIPGRLF